MRAHFFVEFNKPEQTEKRGRKKKNFDGLRINETATQIFQHKMAQVRESWQTKGLLDR